MTLDSARAFLLDIDGTTLLGNDALPGACAFIARLRSSGRRHLWMTNNTSMSRDGWLDRLEAAGLEPRPEEVYTAGDATIDWLKGNHESPRVYLLGTPDLWRSFEDAGITPVRDDPDAVVLGFDQTLTYDRIRTAAQLIREGVPFIATHPDITCPMPDGPIPDVGSFIAMFEAAVGKSPRIIGKPEPTMVEGALTRLGAQREEAVVVGDRLETDIRMANHAGLGSVLVLTGVTAGADVGAAEDKPTQVVESLADLLEAIG